MPNGRFDAVKSLIVGAETIADVGCDHGIIAEYCLKSGIARRVIASDISERCLDKARLKLQNSYGNVTFVCCDGIEYECDEAVIAGMGGLLICDIIKRAVVKPETLVLCPHRNYAEVRKTLIELGYGIEKDIVVAERGKFYFVIRAVKGGGSVELDEFQLRFGLDCRKRNAVLADWLVKLYNTYLSAPIANAERLSFVKDALKLQGIDTDTDILKQQKSIRRV